jgi:hypothetical protein
LNPEALQELGRAVRAVREESDPAVALKVIGEGMDRLIGSTMFTFLRFDYAAFTMERLHGTQPGVYGKGFSKPMRRGRWYETLVDRGEVFFASGAKEMGETFGDYASLAAMGVTSTMCVPVRHAGRTLGTMNLNGEAGRYGPAQAALALPFATLAVPAYLSIGRA